jgi:hypothetical protein
MRRNHRAGLLVVLLVGQLACAARFIHGGKAVDPGYAPHVLIAYEVEGAAGSPQATRCFLVQVQRREAMLEQAPDGKGMLFENRWRDGEGDHFSLWISSGDAYEFIVPPDRQLPATKFFFPAGTYVVRREVGFERLVPVSRAEASARLIPVEQEPPAPTATAIANEKVPPPSPGAPQLAPAAVRSPPPTTQPKR